MIFLSFPDLMYSSTLESNVDIPLGEKKHEETSQSEGPIDTLNMYKQTDRIVNKTTPRHFTSSAFILSPFAESPLHLNQNFNSSFLSSDSFRSTRNIFFRETRIAYIHIGCHVECASFHPGLTSLALMSVVTIPSKRSTIMKVVYEIACDQEKIPCHRSQEN